MWPVTGQRDSWSVWQWYQVGLSCFSGVEVWISPSSLMPLMSLMSTMTNFLTLKNIIVNHSDFFVCCDIFFNFFFLERRQRLAQSQTTCDTWPLTHEPGCLCPDTSAVSVGLGANEKRLKCCLCPLMTHFRPQPCSLVYTSAITTQRWPPHSW